MKFTSITGRAAQSKLTKEQLSEAGKKGFEVTMERHPFFARKYLKAKIKGRYPQGRVVKEVG